MADFKKDESESKYFSKRPNTKPTSKYTSRTGKTKNSNKMNSKQHTSHTHTHKKTTNTPFSMKNLFSGKNNLNLILMGSGIAVVLLLLFIFTHNNAYEVYLSDESGDQLIGTIEMDDTTTEESFYNTAISKLSESVGSKVEVKQTIEFVEVHASNDEIVTQDYVLGELYNKWSYTVEGSVITVDGVEIGALKNPQEAQMVFDNVGKQYVKEGSTYVSTEFVEEVKVETKFVAPEMLGTVDVVTEELKKTKQTTSTYAIQSGDTISHIAAVNNVTSEEIMSLNPGLDTGNLKVGQEIKLVSQSPIVTAKTKENILSEEVVPMPVEERKNPNEYKTYTKVISEGKDGKAEVTTQITRLNGVEESREVVNSKEIEKPTPQVVEVGTSETPKNI